MHNDNDYFVYKQPQAYYNQDTNFSDSRQAIELDDLNMSFTHVGMKLANSSYEQKHQKNILIIFLLPYNQGSVKKNIDGMQKY